MRQRSQATGLKGSGRKLTIEWSSVGASSTEVQRSKHQQKLKERKQRKQEKVNRDLAPVPKEAPLTAEETWRRIETRREQMKSLARMKRGLDV
mgnify:CR=1 FL=1